MAIVLQLKLAIRTLHISKHTVGIKQIASKLLDKEPKDSKVYNSNSRCQLTFFYNNQKATIMKTPHPNKPIKDNELHKEKGIKRFINILETAINPKDIKNIKGDKNRIFYK